MSIRRTSGLERAQPEGRRYLEPSPFSARAAGLYSEVVWDRSGVAPSPTKRRAMIHDDHRASPAD